MTNLTEKLLIMGMGILFLVSFLTLINPFIDLVAKYDKYEEKYDLIISNIEKIDSLIKYSIDQKRNYTNEIFIFYDLNITIEEIQLKYEFFITEKETITYTYNYLLKNYFFILKSQRNYSINILLSDNITIINFQLKK